MNRLFINKIKRISEKIERKQYLIKYPCIWSLKHLLNSFYLYLKSMKFLNIALLASVLGIGSSTTSPVFQCGEGKVPSHELGICIEPEYI